MGTCFYRNTSKQMVILRCIGPETFFQEKVVFQFEDWQFRCPPQHTAESTSGPHGLTGAEQLDSINAEDLLLQAEVVPPRRRLTQDNRVASAFSYGLEGRTSMSPSTGMPTTDPYVLPISLPLNGPAGCSSRWGSEPAREDHHGKQQGHQHKLAQHRLHLPAQIPAQVITIGRQPWRRRPPNGGQILPGWGLGLRHPDPAG